MDFGTKSNKPEYGYHYIWCKFSVFFTKISKYRCWYTSVIWKNYLRKMESTPIFAKRFFFFHTKTKNRTIGLWDGGECMWVRWKKKKTHTPLNQACKQLSKHASKLKQASKVTIFAFTADIDPPCILDKNSLTIT